MADPYDEHGPTPNRPLNAPGKRPTLGPLLIAVGLLVLLAIVFLILFTLR